MMVFITSLYTHPTLLPFNAQLLLFVHRFLYPTQSGNSSLCSRSPRFAAPDIQAAPRIVLLSTDITARP